jgi:hypothetical protein
MKWVYRRKASIGGLGALRGAFESVGGNTRNGTGAISGAKYDALMAKVPASDQ